MARVTKHVTRQATVFTRTRATVTMVSMVTTASISDALMTSHASTEERAVRWQVACVPTGSVVTPVKTFSTKVVLTSRVCMATARKERVRVRVRGLETLVTFESVAELKGRPEKYVTGFNDVIITSKSSTFAVVATTTERACWVATVTSRALSFLMTSASVLKVSQESTVMKVLILLPLTFMLKNKRK